MLCTRCGEDKPESDFLRDNRTGKPRRPCKVCHYEITAAWRARNRERWAKAVQDNAQRREQRMRDEMIAAYGGKCAQCGEADPDVLELDHVSGNGAQHREQVAGARNRSIKYWLRANNYPPGFQLLCANCHRRKSRREWRQRWGLV